MALATWPQRLLEWYARHRRRLPWRELPSPYRVWLSEAMLQQTQVATVVPYFARFVARFPDVAALAAADVDAVLKLWEGLGYYARARQLHAAARAVVAHHGGQLPRTAAALRQLPGFGPYTAAAVASIAFGEPVPVVDGNVARVLARCLGRRDDVRRAAAQAQLAGYLAPFVRDCGDPGGFNQALMELGALVCTPRAPNCAACPLAPECVARRDGLTAVLPRRTRAKPTPHYRVAIGLIWRDGRLLVQQRRATGMLGGLWELPGGRVGQGETAPAALVRKVLEQNGLRLAVDRRRGSVRQAYSHFRITLAVFACRWLAGRPRARRLAAVRWVTPAAAGDLPLGRAARRALHDAGAAGG